VESSQTQFTAFYYLVAFTDIYVQPWLCSLYDFSTNYNNWEGSSGAARCRVTKRTFKLHILIYKAASQVAPSNMHIVTVVIKVG